jgi:hypothetical protein
MHQAAGLGGQTCVKGRVLRVGHTVDVICFLRSPHQSLFTPPNSPKRKSTVIPQNWKTQFPLSSRAYFVVPWADQVLPAWNPLHFPFISISLYGISLSQHSNRSCWHEITHIELIGILQVSQRVPNTIR